MELMAWTDERLAERFDRIDERFDGVDARFDRVDEHADAAAKETRRQFGEVTRRIDDLAGDTGRRIDDLAADTRQRLDETREEMRLGFDSAKEGGWKDFNQLNERITESKQAAAGVKREVAELRTEMRTLQLTLTRASFSVISCLIGVIGAILIKGG
jgi:chromosome segregation ATPase